MRPDVTPKVILIHGNGGSTAVCQAPVGPVIVRTGHPADFPFRDLRSSITDVILDRLLPDDGFTPVSRGAVIGWGVFYGLFLLYAAANQGGFLLIDFANLMAHEAGHFLFSWFGYYTMILGGTLGQLLVPLLCALAFVRRGETTGVAFCGFWWFENFLYIATYIGDARRAALPLVGSEESDWTILLTHWGILQHDRTIASWVNAVGWMGMLATVGWLVWMHVTVDDRRRDNAF